jgi:Protein of unknown function (DUF3618)
VSVQDNVLPVSRQPMPGPAKPEKPRQRTPAEIEQDLDETTQQLVSRVDELVYRMHPRQLVRRGMAELKAKVVEPDGRPRKEIVGAAIGALVGLAVLVWRSRRRG